MADIKVDHRGKVFGYPISRKGWGKRSAAKTARRNAKAEIRAAIR